MTLEEGDLLSGTSSKLNEFLKLLDNRVCRARSGTVRSRHKDPYASVISKLAAFGQRCTTD